MTTLALEVGGKAPEFRLKGPGGQWISLSDYVGYRNVVLVFYPLAFSPVCSHQLREIQERLNEFRELDTEVFGVSVDSHFANEAFARMLRVEFPLLSDFKREAMSAYGVLLGEAGFSGRALFLIDRQGRVAYRDVSLNPGSQAQIPDSERLLAALRALPR
jgi:peroxiredoxin (alkyl hydroperoxide reductase subunit C)